MNKLSIGIDLGGTDIKGGIVDSNGKIVLSNTISTQSDKGAQHVIERIATLINKLLNDYKINIADITQIGIGIPGMINSGEGIVTYSNNLVWQDVHIVSMLKKQFNTTIKIANDANAAALGEALCGAGKGKNTSVMITLGTGVGSGIVIDKKLFEGNKGAGAEVGHMVIKMQGGHKCTCGLSGCLETEASATALTREIKAALQNNKNSKMWGAIKNLKDAAPKLAFDFYDTDETAKEVIDNYILGLATGIINIINIFRPECVIIGGGISKQGDNLLTKLNEVILKNQFGGGLGPKVELVIAKLKNDAGTVGAAFL